MANDHTAPRAIALTALAAALALLPADAPAQSEPGCWVTRDGPMIAGNTAAYFDQNVTNNWYRTLQMADGNLMARIAGTYYGEIPAPQLGMINYQYRTYDPNGLFQYQDRTCSQTGCSENYGHGRWAAHATQRNTIYIMVNWTDLIRQNACISAEVIPGESDLIDAANGARWVRVR